MYEYKVIEAPAPSRRGFFRKSSSYAETLSQAINEAALENWEFQRAEAGLHGKQSMLVFRKLVEKAKASEDMGEPRSFSDRLLEAEGGKAEKTGRRDRGREYSGPIKPRRAKVLLDDAGTITERPNTIDSEAFYLDASAYEATSTERVTPYKPTAAAV